MTDALNEINKKAGKIIAFYGNDESIDKCDVIPTGILSLDIGLGVGGIPRGCITDIYGMPSVGKSSLCFTIMAQAQKIGLRCALIDAEYSYRPEYVEHFGVDPSTVIILQPDCFEDAAEAIETLIRSKETDVIVIDSVSSLVPRAEAEAEHGKSPMAIQARLMSQMMRKLVGPIAKNNVALICINQMRVNLMAMGHQDRYTVTGGHALKFYAKIRMEIKRSKALMESATKVAGYNIIFQIKKNKLARVSHSCEVRYFLDTGFETDGNIVELAVEKGLIKQEGAWLFHGESKWHGKEKATETIYGDPELKQSLVSALLPQTGTSPTQSSGKRKRAK